MCRYALHPAKTHFACLPCRYTGKLPQWRDRPSCPNCAAPMVDMEKFAQEYAPSAYNLHEREKAGPLCARVDDQGGCGHPESAHGPQGCRPPGSQVPCWCMAFVEPDAPVTDGAAPQAGGSWR